jgi:hypothetical protein
MAIARTAQGMVTDTYDLQWHAGEPDRRIKRMAPRAFALARCVPARDAHGVRVVLEKIRAEEDWAALAIILAECADPAALAIVCGGAPGKRVAA